MTFLRASEDRCPARLRRVITAVSLSSLAVYSFTLLFASPVQAQSRTRKAYVRAETVRLRSGPGTNHKATALLDAGRKAKVVERKDGWVKLRLATGTEGWVRSDLLSISKKRTPDTVASSSTKKKKTAEASSSRTKKKSSEVAKSSSSSSRKKAVATSKPAAEVSTRRTVAAKPKPAASKPAAPKPAAPAHVVAAPKPAVKKPVVKPAAAAAARKPTLVKLDASSTTRTGLAPAPVTRLIPIRRSEEGGEGGTTTEQPTTSPTRTETAPPPATGGGNGSGAPEREKSKGEGNGGGGVEDAAEAQIVAAVASEKSEEKPVINRATTRSSRVDRLIKSALAYRGTRYRMGASGRGAFDCSGFTSFLFKQAGEPLPRTAAQQYRVGTPVAKSQMRPGDLVFFKNTYKRGISHVGIYIGNGKFVHASSGGGGVRTNSLSESYYQRHWAGARRPKIVQATSRP